VARVPSDRAAQELLGWPLETRVAELLVALRLAEVVREKPPRP
jgi:hypothetical protein